MNGIDYKLMGKRISTRRKQLGLKQTEVEEKANLSQKYLSNIETGKSIPSIDVLLRLCHALETTPDVFLLGISESHNDNNIAITKKLNDLKLTNNQNKILSDSIDFILAHNIN